ncbi:heat shock 70 kDa protein 12A-like [Saccostrea cucullata]|uniref:heat shock 70 kDa protein 12A-like n=1 Tax=Saccostrea cuccullata TaxID=36930 RepID=UPI002ED20BB3
MTQSVSTPAKLLVAAIDFGTTFSGYAFAFRNDYVKDPLKIHGNQWTIGSQAGVSLKTSTCALFNPQGEFDSFGTQAEDRYGDLALEENHHDWYYFRRFKMILYNNQTVARDLAMEDDKGNTLPAMKVFAACIKYLREHMMDACSTRRVDIEDDEIQWVLTVPAIWTDSAKQFMREAATRAGIRSDLLVIALEPEAASIYCKHLPVNKIEGDNKKSLDSFSPGTKYLVLDAGGGTIDITVQEVQPGGLLREVYKANGGDWGGTKVDEAFMDFLKDIVGESVIERFKEEHRCDYVELCRDFEIKKRTITPDMDQKVTFKIPIAINELYQEMKGTSIRNSTSGGNKYGSRIAWIGDKLRVDSEIAKDLFKVTCASIVEHVYMIFQQEEVDNTETILMVGGFSESPMLRSAVKERFPEKRVIIPQEAGLSVLKGAVIFGFNTTVIASRICRYTYGISVYDDFRSGVDPEDKLITIEDRTFCKDRFSKHAEAGQSMDVGEATEEKTYRPTRPDQTQITLKVYVTEDRDPVYTDDPGCTCLGPSLTVDIPDTTGGLKRKIGVKLIFGGTELSVEARIMKTGETTSASLDFLNHEM